MVAKKLEGLEGEMEALKVNVGAIGEKLERLAGIDDKFANLEIMFQRIMEGQARPNGEATTSRAGKEKVGTESIHDDEGEEVEFVEPYYNPNPRRGRGSRDPYREPNPRRGGEGYYGGPPPLRRGGRETLREPPVRGGRGGMGNTWGGGDPRVRKLKMPVFEGEDAHGWIYRVERYFAVNGLTEEERLTVAGLCLDGEALALFQWREMRQPLESWAEFRDCLLERFQHSGEGGFYEQFIALQQEGTVREYRKQFEFLASRIGYQTEAVLEGNFMKGLRPEIRTAVRTLKPGSLGEAMEYAQLVEDQRQSERASRGGGFDTQHRTTTATFMASKGAAPPATKSVPQGRGTTALPVSNFRRLTETQIQEKRAKGLCFRCDEKYAPEHRCKDRTLQVLTVCDDEAPEGEEIAQGGEQEEDSEQEHVHLDVAEVSLNSVMGFTTSRTMRVKGEILGI